jgi:hypothetical protein
VPFHNLPGGIGKQRRQVLIVVQEVLYIAGLRAEHFVVSIFRFWPISNAPFPRVFDSPLPVLVEQAGEPIAAIIGRKSCNFRDEFPLLSINTTSCVAEWSVETCSRTVLDEVPDAIRNASSILGCEQRILH